MANETKENKDDKTTQNSCITGKHTLIPDIMIEDEIKYTIYRCKYCDHWE
jgi:aspartate carbamoyltransferase regulatory subunit